MKNLLSRKGFKILTIALVALIVTGGAMGVYYAASKSDDKSGDDITKLKDTIEDAVHIDKSMDGPGKEETVFAIGDANGNIKNLIVSEWLKNPEAKDTLDDYTELSDIKNTNGDETFTSSGGNKYTWNAKGKDIHYRGAIKKELPVKVSMQYLLNGMEITPEELAGKSGQVTIRFNYTNTQKTSADISGAKEDIYTPFVMISGVMLDSDRFSNVTVSSGSVINDGSRNIVVGLAMPGMKESLGITDEDIDFPNYVEIKADTTNFSLSATLTVAMTGLLNNVQIDSGNAVDELKSSLNDLEDAAIKLIDGSSDLYSGSSDLLSGAGDLKSGAGELLSGAKDLKSGAGQVNEGAGDLKAGLGTLSKNSASLNAGAKEIVDAVFDTATTQLREKLVSSGLMTQAQADAIALTRTNYVSVFSSLSKAVTVKPADVEARLRASLAAMTADQQDKTLTIAFDLMAADSKLAYTDAVARAARLAQNAEIANAACSVITLAWCTADPQATLITNIAASMHVDSTTAAKLAAVALYLSPADPSSKLTEAGTILTDAVTYVSTTVNTAKITALCTAVANTATSTGNASLDAVKKKLDDVMEFYNGLLIYTGGVDTACAGSKTLSSGAASLYDGVKKLYDGASGLHSGASALYAGAGDLKDGCYDLKEGMNKFYDEGIQKLTGSLGDDLTGLVDRFKAAADASKTYKSFAGIPEGMKGSVKFIFRTDSIEKDEDQ